MTEAIICDGILHVNMFIILKPYILYVHFFAKFIYNDYIRPYFLSNVVSTIFASDLPQPMALITKPKMVTKF